MNLDEYLNKHIPNKKQVLYEDLVIEFKKKLPFSVTKSPLPYLSSYITNNNNIEEYKVRKYLEMDANRSEESVIIANIIRKHGLIGLNTPKVIEENITEDINHKVTFEEDLYYKMDMGNILEEALGDQCLETDKYRLIYKEDSDF